MDDVNELLKPRPGFFYEPRVLWGQGVISQRGEDDAGTISPKRDSYYNGSRWPIVLTDCVVLVCHPAGLVQDGSTFIQQVPIQVSALGGLRYSLGDIRGLLAPMAARESQESFLYPEAADPQVPGVQTLRSMQNLARWDFDHVLRLPPAAYLEMNLTGRVPTIVDTTGVPVTADVNFYTAAPREGAQWPGATITRTGFDISQLSTAQANFYYAQLYQANGGSVDTGGGPFVLPFTSSFFGGPNGPLYPPRQTFTSRQAVQQKATYDLPTHLQGFSVGFQQHALDAALAEASTAFGPLSATTYSRVRVRNGGTGDYWWRDGAPLAICTPTMTPATVHKLARPLALQPGEGFKLTLPPVLAPESLRFPPLCEEDDVIYRMCSFYLSFTGYAAVEA